MRARVGGRDAHWVFEDRLAGLATSGAIRAIEDLQVTYVLERVGRARATSDAVWDRRRQALLVDTIALGAPGDRATGLALGLTPCIYEGPSQDAVVETLTLLLTLGTPARIQAHLDRRHYPTVAQQRHPLDLLAARLGEVLDYRLDRRLRRRFEALRGADLDPWRARDQLAAIIGPEPAERQEWAARCAPGLLEMIGIGAPSDDLIEALTQILAAPSLDAIPADLLATEDAEDDEDGWVEDALPEAPRPEDSTRSPARVDDHPKEGRGPSGPVPRIVPPPTDGSIAGQEGSSASSGGAPSEALAEIHRQSNSSAARKRAFQEAMESMFGVPSQADRQQRQAAGADRQRPAAAPDWEALARGVAEPDEVDPAPADSGGLWTQVQRFFGGGPEAPPPQAPRWAQSNAHNPVAPTGEIGPQLWTRPEHLRELSHSPPELGFDFEPAELPSPHRYAIQTLGARFEESSQRWLPAGAPPADWYAPDVPRGREVVFQGRVAPGLNQLPLPMYGRLERAPQLLQGRGQLSSRTTRHGQIWLHVDADAPLTISYAVELTQPPMLTGGHKEALAEAPEALYAPTVGLRAFPPPARQLIARLRQRPRPAWEAALAIQTFVQTRYVYDTEFMARPEVARAVARRRLGQGNHHLEVLHASRQGDRVLGRGICYELNLAIVELLRHAGLPAMVATGWVLDRGRIHRPDHFFALVILPGPQGPCLMPLEAATGPQGPLRPMAPEPPRDGLHEEGSLPPIAPPPGPWSSERIMNMPSPDDLDRGLGQMRQQELEAARAEAELARRALVHLCAVSGRALPDALGGALEAPGPEHLGALRAHGARQLDSPTLFAALMAVLRGDYEEVAVLPPAVRELVRQDLVRVRTVSRYHVSAEVS